MGKYVISFEDEPSFSEDGFDYYTCIQAPWWRISNHILDRLEEYEPPKEVFDKPVVEKQSYQEGYEAGFKEGRKRTELSEEKDVEDILSEVWNCAARIFSPDVPKTLSGQEIIDIFGCEYNSAHELNPIEAVKKLKEYDKKQEQKFNVGDEIMIIGGNTKAVVTYVFESDDGIEFIYDSGKVGECHSLAHDYWRKTGRRFEYVDDLKSAMEGF